MRAKVKLAGGVSPCFVEILNGILQGSPLSVTLFTLLMDTLAEELERCDCDFPTIYGLLVCVLLFVDDIALPALSPLGCQRALSVLANLISLLDMKINVDKSEYVVFNNSP